MIIKKKLKKNFESKTLQIIQESLNDDKVLDLKIINIEKKAFFADYIIIASGTSKRHISTMAKNLRKKVKNILNYLKLCMETQVGLEINLKKTKNLFVTIINMSSKKNPMSILSIYFSVCH